MHSQSKFAQTISTGGLQLSRRQFLGTAALASAGLTTAPLPALAGATRPTFSVSLLSASPEVFDLISWRLWDPLMLAVGIPDIRAEAARECDLLLVTDRLGERRQTAKNPGGGRLRGGHPWCPGNVPRRRAGGTPPGFPSAQWHPMINHDGEFVETGPKDFGPDLMCDEVLGYIQQRATNASPFFIYSFRYVAPRLLAAAPQTSRTKT